MRQYLLPVWAHSRFNSAAGDIGLDSVDWVDLPPLSHGHCLISYLHWQQPFEFPEHAYVFGDSGGFALRATASRPRHLGARTVLAWHEEHCTVGCVLDVPPLGGNWDQTLEATLHHTRLALPLYEQMRANSRSFRWWGVLHGNDEDAVRAYHKAVSDIYPFTEDGEGWAIRAEPTVNTESVARSLRLLKELGIRRAHFLAGTNQKVITLLLVLGHEIGLELVTYDSAYAIKSGVARTVFVPEEDGVRFVRRSEAPHSDEHHARDYLRECPCPVCAFMRERTRWIPKARHEIDSGKFGGWWSSWAQLHNMRIQSECSAAQARLASTSPADLLGRMLPNGERDRVLKVFAQPGHENLHKRARHDYVTQA